MTVATLQRLIRKEQHVTCRDCAGAGVAEADLGDSENGFYYGLEECWTCSGQGFF